MREFIYATMAEYSAIVIFLHVLSAAVWLGGLVTLLVLSRKASSEVEQERRFAGRAALFKKLFKFLTPFVIMVALTAIFMALGYKESAMDAAGFVKDSTSFETYQYVNAKIIIYITMVIHMIFTIWIITKAECRLCKTRRATDCMWLVNTYLLPINIILGTIAIYLGVIIRHVS